MRISDWSSDVCSSDLPDRLAQHEQGEKAGPIGRPSGLPARGCVAREQSAVGHAEVTLRCMAVTLMRRTDALIFLMVLSLALARGIDIGAEEHRFLHVLVDPFQQLAIGCDQVCKDRKSTRLNSSH